jgi:hypothetical protein
VTTQSENAQAGMFDIDLTGDTELLEACKVIEESRAVVKRLRKAIAIRKERIKAIEHTLDDNPNFHEERGARIRVGEFVLTAKPRSGGGFEVPEWTSAVVAKQERL